MRWLTLFLSFAACAQPAEEPCLLSDKLTERDASSWVENGRTILAVTGPECGAGACIRDRTVEPGAPGSAALGYCARLCELGCFPGTQCAEVNGLALCLRSLP